MTATDHAVEHIGINVIDPDPDNRSAPIDDEFVGSISTHGVLMPILVTPADDGRYRIVAGERRWRAAKQAGHDQIPAAIREATDSDRIVWQAIENLARVDLTPSQEAQQVARALEAGMRQKQLAKALNQPLSWVRARLALVGLPEGVQTAMDAGELEPSDALTLAKWAERPEVIEEVIGRRYIGDLAWQLERTAERFDRQTEAQRLIEEHEAAGYTVHDGLTAISQTPKAKPLTFLGLDPDEHRGEPCHAVAVRQDLDSVVVEHWCVEPSRHRGRGNSDLRVENVPEISDAKQAERESAQQQRAAKAHRDAFVRAAIGSRLRAKDVNEFVLPVLFDTAGMTEKKDAARLLGLDPIERQGYKDYTGPLNEWAAESSANLTRAMLAIGYVAAMQRSSWRDSQSSQALAAWLDRLGYQPEDI